MFAVVLLLSLMSSLSSAQEDKSPAAASVATVPEAIVDTQDLNEASSFPMGRMMPHPAIMPRPMVRPAASWGPPRRRMRFLRPTWARNERREMAARSIEFTDDRFLKNRQNRRSYYEKYATKNEFNGNNYYRGHRYLANDRQNNLKDQVPYEGNFFGRNQNNYDSNNNHYYDQINNNNYDDGDSNNHYGDEDNNSKYVVSGYAHEESRSPDDHDEYEEPAEDEGRRRRVRRRRRRRRQRRREQEVEEEKEFDPEKERELYWAFHPDLEAREDERRRRRRARRIRRQRLRQRFEPLTAVRRAVDDPVAFLGGYHVLPVDIRNPMDIGEPVDIREPADLREETEVSLEEGERLPQPLPAVPKFLMGHPPVKSKQALVTPAPLKQRRWVDTTFIHAMHDKFEKQVHTEFVPLRLWPNYRKQFSALVRDNVDAEQPLATRLVHRRVRPNLVFRPTRP